MTANPSKADNKCDPLVSVVMPSLNQVDFLGDAIASVLQQSYRKLQLVVIDGGSSDGSLDLLSSINDSRLIWVSGPDNGQSDAINKGFQRADGEIIGWLNSDDTFESGAVAAAVKVIRDTGARIVMASRFALIRENGELAGVKDNTYHDRETLIRYWRTGGMTVNQPSVFFSRELLIKAGGMLDTSLDYAMDYDLWLRMTKYTDIKVVEGHWANYRFHPTSKSGMGFEPFFIEWRAVSRRYWGDKGFYDWIRHAFDFLYASGRHAVVRRLAR